MARRRLLALVPPSSRGAAEAAAADVGWEVRACEGVQGALAALEEGPWHAVVLSFSVDHVDPGVVQRFSERAGAPLFLVDRRASLDRTLEGRAAGAASVLPEPFEAGELARRLRSLGAGQEAVELPEPAESADGTPIVGRSPGMLRVFDLVARVADAPATVLVTGESGTGKELVARALHEASPRAGGPFVAVNCAAIPEALLESELFGHAKGAFTGAVADRVGRFERADGGTLFLDEVGDMSLVLQAKILRALEAREVEPVGGRGAVGVDVRVVAATHRRLEERMEAGEFREDLYYRLAVVRIDLPPLRERGDDVEALALHFAADFAARHGRPVRRVTRPALERLRAHSWPGNVRELRNAMDRAVLLAAGDAVTPDDLVLGPQRETGGSPGYPPTLSLAEVEGRHVARVLRETGGHMGRAADILGVHRNTLTRKVREHGIEPGSGAGPAEVAPKE